jgi:glyoxalase superfamily protein
MALFKDLCLDASDPSRLGAFWAAVPGHTWEAKNGKGLLTGRTPQHTIWVNPVPGGGPGSTGQRPRQRRLVHAGGRARHAGPHHGLRSGARAEDR